MHTDVCLRACVIWPVCISSNYFTDRSRLADTRSINRTVKSHSEHEAEPVSSFKERARSLLSRTMNLSSDFRSRLSWKFFPKLVTFITRTSNTAHMSARHGSERRKANPTLKTLLRISDLIHRYLDIFRKR